MNREIEYIKIVKAIIIISNSVTIRESLKKSEEFSTKRGGRVGLADFPLRKTLSQNAF